MSDDETSPMPAAPFKVLVVEDDPNLLEGLMELVSELGEVRGAHRIPDAVTALKSERFGLVLTDLGIGGEREGGVQLIRLAHEALTPAALVTGALGQKLADLGGAHDSDAVISKPFGIDDVLSTVQRFIRLRDQTSALVKDGSSEERALRSRSLGVNDPVPPLRSAAGVFVLEGTLGAPGCLLEAGGYGFIHPKHAAQVRSPGGSHLLLVPLADAS